MNTGFKFSIFKILFWRIKTMGILKCEAVTLGLKSDECSSALNTLSASERKAYSSFLALSMDERKCIAEKIKAGKEVEPALKIGYEAYTKIFK